MLTLRHACAVRTLAMRVAQLESESRREKEVHCSASAMQLSCTQPALQERLADRADTSSLLKVSPALARTRLLPPTPPNTLNRTSISSCSRQAPPSQTASPQFVALSQPPMRDLMCVRAPGLLRLL
jgi:hypothetical protein